VAINSTKNPAKVNYKNIVITFVCVGILAWFPLSTLMLNIFDLLADWVPNPKILGIVEVSNLVSILLCVLVVVGLVKNEGAYNFTNEVFIELGKVSWPIKKGTGIPFFEKIRQLRESTMVVLISIVLLSIVIAGIDLVLQFFMKVIF